MARRPLSNRDVARIFSDIAALLDIKGENRYRVLAYRRAAEAIEHLDQELYRYWQEGRLREIPHVGDAIAQKIDELFRTGRLTFLERLEAEYPRHLVELLRVPDLGPRRVRTLYRELGIATPEEVARAARAGQLRRLPGFGPKVEANILRALERLPRDQGRVLLSRALEVASELLEALRAAAGADVLVRAEVAGSLRRRRATVGDVDLVAASPAPEEVVAAFVRLPHVAEVRKAGPTRASVRLHNGLRADLRAVRPEQWGAAWQYFTGSQAHNVRLRELALGRGLSLNEYGFRREDGTEVPCAREAEVYARLGLPWIPPELREDRGEIEAGLEGQLPALVSLEDIRGDLHVHTVWSDGRLTVEAMVQAARARGYEYIVITDHSTGLGVVRGLDPERLRRQREEIQAVNARYDDITVLQGAEVEIMADGTLAYPDEVLASLDVVVASLHTGLRQPRAQITRRLLAAIRHPLVHIVGHPTGRLLLRRAGADLEMEAVLRAAAETGTALEINASPERLDLDARHVRRAVELGCRLVINSDAHRDEELDNVRYGVWQARRGWAEARHILNTRPLPALLAALRVGGEG